MIPIGYFPENPNEIIIKARRIKTSDEVKEKIIIALKTGNVVNSYRGLAGCRICGKILGSQDLSYGSFIFPSKWEHYVIEHDLLPVFNMNNITTEFIDYIQNTI